MLSVETWSQTVDDASPQHLAPVLVKRHTRVPPGTVANPSGTMYVVDLVQ